MVSSLLIMPKGNKAGKQHGHGVARRIEQLGGDLLAMNEGTVYTALLRLIQHGWVVTEWGTPENTRKGRKQPASETANRERISRIIGRVLALAGPRSRRCPGLA